MKKIGLLSKQYVPEKIPRKDSIFLKKITSIFLAFVLLNSVFLVSLNSEPIWRYTANHNLKLFGMILIADERGDYWSEELPQG